MAKDIEQAIEEVKSKGFKVSINNIIAIVTFLSTVIAGWYSFTGLKSHSGSIIIVPLYMTSFVPPDEAQIT